MKGAPGPLSMTRRAALAASFAAPLAALQACRKEEYAPPGTLVALSALPEARRVRVLRGDEPVELVRHGDEVTARSLWCTHMGCEVAWNEARGRYRCPCHEGEYDADGHAVAGPPPHDLPTIPVTRWRNGIVLPPRAKSEDVEAPHGQVPG